VASDSELARDALKAFLDVPSLDALRAFGRALRLEAASSDCPTTLLDGGSERWSIVRDDEMTIEWRLGVRRDGQPPECFLVLRFDTTAGVPAFRLSFRYRPVGEPLREVSPEDLWIYC
jgi:hypothetical protein